MTTKKAVGTKKWHIGAQPFYRLGVTYPAWSVVELPADVPPSRTWRVADPKLPVGTIAAGFPEEDQNTEPMPESPLGLKSLDAQTQMLATPFTEKEVKAGDPTEDKHNKGKK
ncbi:MAG: hypothetical protein IAG10_14360 [Planctomycetaceae bacterium]|nr:hypothetical protein [Planctomycetaceae bacterium]